MVSCRLKTRSDGNAPWPGLIEMFRRVKAGLLYLLAYGTEIYPPKIARRLKILNGLAGLIVIFSLQYAITYAQADYVRYAPFIWLNLALVVMGLAVPFMHRYGELAGAALVAVSEYLAIFAFTAMMGREAGTQINFIVGAAAPFFVFGLERRFLGIMVIIACFAAHIAAWFLFPSEKALIGAEQYLLNELYLSSAIATFAVVAALVYYAFNLAEQAEAATESLLRNVLPDTVVDRLQASPDAQVSDSFDDVAIVFTDLAGFVSIAHSLGATATVELLNDMVSRFDQLAKKHGVEKIKTIGDSYMAAIGVPEPTSNQANKILQFAQDIQKAAKQTEEKFRIELPMRIGVASGPVMAGIIGEQKFSYDVWGDAVNLAARLESSGMPGRIHVSDSVQEQCRGSFSFEHRGKLDVKGFGLVDSWFLTNSEQSDFSEQAGTAA